MTIGEFCNREVVVAPKESTIVEVAKLMRQHHVGDVVVVDSSGDENVPVGIITDRDIVLEIIAREVDQNTVAVGDVMSHELVMAKEQDGIWVTLQRMRSYGVRRLPVINERGGLEGILTVDDLLDLLSEELLLLAGVVKREIDQEKNR